MIVDLRLRPPWGKFRDNFVFAPEFLAKYARDSGLGIAQSARERSMPLLLAEMARAGVTRAVVPLRKFSSCADFSVNVPGMYSNDDLEELLAAYPAQFIGMAGVDYGEGVEAMLADVARYVRNGQSQGVFFEPSVGVQPTYANSRELYPLYAYCQEQEITLLVTFGGTGSTRPEYYYPAVLDQVARDFPALTLIVSHGGWPWVREICAVACNRRNVYISPDLYGVNTPGYQDYVQAANYRLQDRMIFASAYPCLPVEEAVAFYQHCGIKREIWPKFFGENALRALRLA